MTLMQVVLLVACGVVLLIGCFAFISWAGTGG